MLLGESLLRRSRSLTGLCSLIRTQPGHNIIAAGSETFSTSRILPSSTSSARSALAPLDPYNFDAAIGIGIAHFHAERFAEAASWARQGIAEKPSATWAWRIVAAAYANLGRLDEAREALACLVRAHPGITIAAIKQASMPPSPSFQHALFDGLRAAGLAD